MAANWYYGVLSEKSWHGGERSRGEIVPEGTSVADGIDRSRVKEIVWSLEPAYVSVNGKFVPLSGRSFLVRQPTSWDPEIHVLESRIVRDYEIIPSRFLADLALDIAAKTGWTFEGAGSLSAGEAVWIQLRLTDDFIVGGQKYERHSTKLVYADDKRSGSGYIGLAGTRIQCDNTFRWAVNESGVIKVPHVASPKERMKLAHAGIEFVVSEQAGMKAMLDKFYTTAIGKAAFRNFVEELYPTPSTPRVVVEAMQAEDRVNQGLLQRGEVINILERAEAAQKAYENNFALAERRREGTERAYDNHNRRFPDSAETLFAAHQAGTYLPNHAGSDYFLGDALAGILFGGVRGQVIDRCNSLLVEMVKS